MRTPQFVLFALCCFATGSAQAQNASAAGGDPWQALRFLDGVWEAKTGGGTAEAKVIGVYSFQFELNGRILARHSGNSSCKAPTEFDCEHSDLLYLYPEDASIQAIYFDNEGHVIHYGVTTPTPGNAVFLSDPALPGPQFRLLYERRGAVLSGKFQMRMDRKAEFKSYLEWSGGRR